MRSNSPIGGILKGKQPKWAFDMRGKPIFWTQKARELHRMVELGFASWKNDMKQTMGYINEIMENSPTQEHSSVPYNESTLFVSFFLAALAIENLLKAHLISAHPESIKNGRFQGKFISSHNLLEVAIKANVELNDDEKDFCELGTESILIFGRYHIGKNMTETPCKISITESAFVIYNDLYRRLTESIYTNPFGVIDKKL